MNIRTKMTLLAGLASVGPALALPITSVTFGPWTSVGSFETAFLDLTGPAGVADFSVTFSASGTFRAADGTPNNTLETYTLKYGLVSVSLSSASGILIPDPVVVNFVDVGVVVNYLTPATGTPAFILNGDRKNYKPFIDDTRADNIPYTYCLGKTFVQLASAQLPRIYYLDKGWVVKKVDYYELNQYHIENWVNKEEL